MNFKIHIAWFDLIDSQYLVIAPTTQKKELDIKRYDWSTGDYDGTCVRTSEQASTCCKQILQPTLCGSHLVMFCRQLSTCACQ